MRPKVFATRRIPTPGIELISESCDVAVYEGTGALSREELLRSVRDKDGLLCIPQDRIDREVFDAAPNLKAISTYSVGYEHIDVEEATRRGIYIGYTPGVLTDATADLAFALILAAARRIAEADRYVRGGKWQAPFGSMSMLGEPVWGATLGIVGFGRIGRAVAARAEGFQMRVLYHDSQRLAAPDEGGPGADYRDLDDLLAASDFVSLHVPHSGQTHHLIGERELRLMKPTAMLINTSRGSVVDEAALARALKEGWVAGAGLDVYEQEPLDSRSPLLGMENVTLLPHIGSGTKKARREMAELAAQNLLAALRGEAPVHWLNPDAAKRRPLG
ncbi:MAG TPA: D-glycerate dehydrogenase [Syntrophorhabdales bacterium]|nr:D-glycerate dehydrogenase [Syntrophorhabdales bacterium]